MSDDYQSRFSGLARLYGEPGLAALRQAHIAVIGIGGVGSWSAEACARYIFWNLSLTCQDLGAVRRTPE